MTTDNSTRPAVALYRVSTKRQGDSGLGLEAQEAAVQLMAKARGLQIIASFIEVESGRKKQQDRPQLAAALAEARRTGAVIVLAKLDRLSRDAELLLRLSREAQANGLGGFLFCDLPEVDATSAAGRLILSLMASVAEFESRRIGERTKAALAVRKAAGKPLGSNLPKGKIANARRATEAQQRAQKLADMVTGYRRDGLSHAAIAAKLEGAGVPTPSGKPWQAMAVSRILKRLEQASQP